MTESSNIIFRTPIKAPSLKCDWLNHSAPIVSFGSCFSNEIGEQLRMRLFNIDINPYGTLYNPESIAIAIEEILEQKHYTGEDILQDSHGTWHSMMHHSAFSSSNKQKIIDTINGSIRDAYSLLTDKNPVVIITFGSARCFCHLSSGKIVGNCHKLPSSLFETRDLETTYIIERYSRLIQRLTVLCRDIKFIFTVSPIRHLSYGMHEDKISKAKLLLATDTLEKSFDNVYYFPAYEIMTDDLRDYRFYSEDMVHPNQTAVDYIYTIFEQMFLTETEIELNRECLKLTRRLSHRITERDEVQTRNFIDSTNELERHLTSSYPQILKAINRFRNEKQ